MAAEFTLTAKQDQANELLASAASHIMLAGGSRSGKTFLYLRAIIIRALKAPGSRHAIFRFRFGHAKQSIIHDTMPKVFQMCWPKLKYELNMSDCYAVLPNGSEIWVGGLDEKQRLEKVLGNEFVTIFLNECSQIPWSSRNVALTRLAQLIQDTVHHRPLPLKMYYDMNPGDKGHWTYKVFKLKQDPETRNPLPDPDNYAFMQLNPSDNLQNLPSEYIKSLESLSARMRRRFLEGEFREMAPNALFVDEVIDKWRVIDTELPEMLRIVVAVDPSGAEEEDNADNDEIGIIVGGLGTDGNAYIFEDCTCKAGPATWGRVATQAYERHSADRIVGEINFGGAMVRHVIHTSRPRTPYRALTASRGKVVRAEPVSSLCETGKVRLVGYFPQLEEELYGFTTHGYMGERSPNRADACLVMGTMVVTDYGYIPIERIGVGDRVLTRTGMKRVEWAGKTRENAATLALTLSSGQSIIGTSEHPIWVDGKGFVPLADIRVGDALMPEHEVREWSLLKSYSTVSSTDVIQTIPTRPSGATTGASLVGDLASSIVISGRIIMALFRWGIRSITKTVISSITTLPTWNVLQPETMPANINLQSDSDATERGSRKLKQPLPNGMAVRLGVNGIQSTPNRCGSLLNAKQSVAALPAASPWNHSESIGGFVPAPAIGWKLISTIATKLQLIVQSVASRSGKRSGADRPRPVVVSVAASSSQDVYNLHVEDCHEFVANGVLVHNCIWAISDLFPDLLKTADKPPPVVVQPMLRNTPNAWMHR